MLPVHTYIFYCYVAVLYSNCHHTLQDKQDNLLITCPVCGLPDCSKIIVPPFNLFSTGYKFYPFVPHFTDFGLYKNDNLLYNKGINIVPF